jgi:hypothetical protein
MPNFGIVAASWEEGAGMRSRRGVGLALKGGVLGGAMVWAACAPAWAADKLPNETAMWKQLRKVPRGIDASPPPNYSGDFVSMGADGIWRGATGGMAFAQAAPSTASDPQPDCSTETIVHYAKKAPGSFEAGKKGLLYGVKTHTPETRVATRYWDMPGFNSCALVVYAILKQAGCAWAKYTANAREIYDMAYRSGWRPSTTQKPGCMVAWNSRKAGDRDRIGVAQKQAKPGRTAYRHVGIATGAWLSVDNSSVFSRPTTYFTFRPITYSSPIFLCPPDAGQADPPTRKQP